MVRLRRNAKHRQRMNYMGYIKSEWKCFINWLHYFSPFSKH